MSQEYICDNNYCKFTHFGDLGKLNYILFLAVPDLIVETNQPTNQPTNTLVVKCMDSTTISILRATLNNSTCKSAH